MRDAKGVRPGQVVKVFVDAANPGNAVLNPHPDVDTNFVYALCALFVITDCLFLIGIVFGSAR